ncbi:MAG TPA: S1C family serine protease [Desulfomonilaceae bacterium]|nr:S1C family serine protease [Desulfomonilaceae bacterium]
MIKGAAYLVTMCVLFSASMPSYAQTSVPSVETQVLRIMATKNAGYYHKPWKAPDFSTSRGSGFFFKDEKSFPGRQGLILTNAHVVSMAQSIQVSNGREKMRYTARTVGICDTADFAVLELEPDDLAAYERRNGKVVPFELGDSDPLRVGDKVLGWGYPLGGERISKSEMGEISRIEVSTYAYSQDNWLMIQASLQQNRGNSGGPVLKDGKVVGISFQGMKTTDRINYFIPINLVKHLIPLLNDQSAIPRWHAAVQYMFPRLKDYYRLKPEQGGILVDYIVPSGGPATFGIREKDILTTIDGHEIDNFGEINFELIGQNVFFSEILNRKKVGDPLTISVMREGKPVTLTGKVTPGVPKLVPKVFTGANYFIYSGIGFVELTLNCIDNLGKSGEAFRAKYLDEQPKKPYEKIVIISEIFPEYGLVDASSYLKRVEKIGGEEVLNIEHLYNTIMSRGEKGTKKVLLELSDNLQLPLDIEHAPSLDKEIQERYGIHYMKTPGGFKIQ